jgi:glycosyltransferase involved in cell wall biosynthesis
MKVAIFHDYIETIGGGERVLMELAKKYNADIYTSYFNKNATHENLSKLNIITPKIPIPRIQNLKQWMAKRWFERLNLMDKYDVHICYGLHTVYAGMHNRPSVFYANTVSKALFSKDIDVNELPQPRKFFVKQYRQHEIPKHIIAVKNYMNKTICISDFAKKVVETFYGIKSDVIYPMTINTTKYHNKPSEGYYLCVSRLTKPKRIDKIIEVFNKLHNKKLIIVGTGPEKERLIKLAQNNKNIEFSGIINEKTLLDLYSKCISTIYIPILEDFGIVPVESMASGKPCIGANEGGLKETITHEKTGFLIDPTIENLTKAINQMTPEKAESMKNDCIEIAKHFDKKIQMEKFDKKLKEVVIL